MKVLQNEFFFEEVKRIISQGESVEIIVKGGSMTPYLRDEVDKVVLTPFEPSELKKGDIVLYYNTGKYMLHRIVKRINNNFIIQGDGILNKQDNVALSDIVGIVRFIIRPSGKYYSINRPSYRIYWHLWHFFRPFRRYMIAIYRKISNI